MYSVFLVDDEPPIIRNLKKQLELYSPEFQVIDFAYQGEDALEKISKLKPDVIFTDYSMPCLDGLELAKICKEHFPDIEIVLISGYQDFEIAYKAIKYNVSDYLLKPIDPKEVRCLMERLSQTLYMNRYHLLRQLIDCILEGRTFSDSRLCSVPDWSRFNIQLIRYGEVMGEYPVIEEKEVFELSKKIQKELKVSQFYFFQDHSREIILVLWEESVNSHAAHKEIMNCLESHGIVFREYSTCIRYGDTVSLQQLCTMLPELKRYADDNIVFGENSSLNYPDMIKRKPSVEIGLAKEQRLAGFLKTSFCAGLKKEVLDLFWQWQKDGVTEKFLWSQTEEILRILNKNKQFLSRDFFDAPVEVDTSRLSPAYRKYFEIVWEKMECTAERNNSKHRLPQFTEIEEYLKKNLNLPLSLQDTARNFGVSQPYLSRQFRDKCDKSFNEFVTDLRIKEIKRLILEYPEMSLKDIGAIAGFEDPYYLSRRFKEIEGCTLTEFRKKYCKAR